jgi:hypothetical protein
MDPSGRRAMWCPSGLAVRLVFAAFLWFQPFVCFAQGVKPGRGGGSGAVSSTGLVSPGVCLTLQTSGSATAMSWCPTGTGTAKWSTASTELFDVSDGNFNIDLSGADLTLNGGNIIQYGSGDQVIIYGNETAATSGAGAPDVATDTQAVRSAGYIFAARNNGTNEFLVDYQGDGTFEGTLTVLNNPVSVQGADYGHVYINSANLGQSVGWDISGYPVDGSGNVGWKLNASAGATAAMVSGDLGRLDNNGTRILTFDPKGLSVYAITGDSTGSPGAATINAVCGKSAIASTAASMVLTNSEITSSSLITTTPMQSDTTCFTISAAPGSGSATMKCQGSAVATATTKFVWCLVNR